VKLPDTPSGEANALTLSLWGLEIQFISAGKFFERNPSFSYIVACPTIKEVDHYWKKFSKGAEVMIPLGEYPFSKKYGWLKDKYGVSWQIMYDTRKVQKITPSLMFTQEFAGKAEAAMNYYCKMFKAFGKKSGVLEGHLARWGAAQPPEKEGTISYARFQLDGNELVVMDSAHKHAFKFNEMQTLVVNCKDQKEIDYFWKKLSHVPEAEQCGWVKDQFGVSWQVVPEVMEEMMRKSTPEQMKRVVQAFLPMKKFDLKKLEEAYKG
jgi:predicted 3-demethylubiquinone-9 3-methyltransferase (glyoxalase superfamily)